MSHSVVITFEPVDVWIVKDHRPFDAGLHAHGGGTRLPGPRTVYGCLRTALMQQEGADFSKRGSGFGLPDEARAWLGDAGAPATFRLKGPLLTLSVDPLRLELLLPPPLDLALPRRVRSEDLEVAEPRAPWLPWPERPAVGEDKAEGRTVLTPRDLQRYLDPALGELSRLPPSHGLPQACVYDEELRLGIARDVHTRTAQDAMLYQLRALRFKEGAGLVVEVVVDTDDQRDRLLDLSGRTVALGGKARRARLRVAPGALPLPPPAPALEGRKRLVLLTPLLPGGGGAPPGATLACRVAARTPPDGGFDSAWRRPRPLVAQLPAGTVIDLEEVTDTFRWEDWRMGQSPENTRLGFGLALEGGWNP